MTQEWQPIETAPKDRRIIIGYPGEEPNAAIWTGTAWSEAAFLGVVFDPQPIFWQPMPEPPE